MKTTKEDAQEIRDALKTKGWNSKKVSVRVEYYYCGSSIHVTVKDPSVPYAQVKEIAEARQRIDRDRVTGEILSGGNRFVDVGMTDTVRDALAAPYVDAVRAAVEELKSVSDSSIVPVGDTGAGVSRGVNCGTDCFELWLDGGMTRRHYATGPAALDIALHE